MVKAYPQYDTLCDRENHHKIVLSVREVKCFFSFSLSLQQTPSTILIKSTIAILTWSWDRNPLNTAGFNSE